MIQNFALCPFITKICSPMKFALHYLCLYPYYTTTVHAPVLGHCRQKLTRSGNDFQIARPHVRRLHLAVEILNSLLNKSGLTIQINISFFQIILQKSSYFVPKCTQAAILGFWMFTTRLPPGASTYC